MWNKVKTFVVENRLISIFLALFVLLVASLGIYTNVVPEKDQATKSGSAEYKKAIKETNEAVEEVVGLKIPTKEELNDFLALEEAANGEFVAEADKIAVIEEKYGESVATILASELIPEAGMNSSQKAFLLSDIKLLLDSKKTINNEQEFNKYLSTDSMYNITSTLDSGITMATNLAGFTNGSENELVFDYALNYEDAEKLYVMENAKFIDLENIKVGYFFITEVVIEEKVNTLINFFITPTKDLTYDELKSTLKETKIGINGSFESLDFDSGKFALLVKGSPDVTKQSVIAHSLMPATLVIEGSILKGEDTLMVQDESAALIKTNANYRVELKDK